MLHHEVDITCDSAAHAPSSLNNRSTLNSGQ